MQQLYYLNQMQAGNLILT